MGTGNGVHARVGNTRPLRDAEASPHFCRFSDIDIAILPEQLLPPGLLLDLQDALESSEALYPVDLVDLSEAPAALRERVLAEGVLWNVG